MSTTIPADLWLSNALCFNYQCLISTIFHDTLLDFM